MNDQLTRIEAKLDKIEDRIFASHKVLAAQTAQVEGLVKRLSAAERRLEPLEKHVAMVGGAAKLVGILSLVSGIAVGIKQWFE